MRFPNFYSATLFVFSLTPCGFLTSCASRDSAAPPQGDSQTADGDPAGASEGGAPGDGTPLQPCPPESTTFQTFPSIPYGDLDAQVLSLRIPNEGGPFPLLVWVHGGAWTSGSYAEYTRIFDLAQKGFAVASVEYRLSGVAPFPAQIHDVKFALRWLRAHAAEYNVDGARIAILGPSAGGHLSALAGTSGGVAALEDLSQGYPDVSSGVQAVVDFFGPTDFALMDVQAAEQGCPAEAQRHGLVSSPESQLLDCRLAECPDRVQAANPIAYVDASDPPFLILHGRSDCTVSYKQSEVMSAALDSHGVEQSLHLIEGVGHSLPGVYNPSSAPVVEAFLSRILRGCVAP